MTDYRFVMSLLHDGRSYRQIAAIVGCSHASIAKARRVIAEQGLATAEQIAGLTAEEVDALFADGRRMASEQFVDFDVKKVVAARTGRKKPTLRVLWANYLDVPAPEGLRHYSYERFRGIVANYVDAHDLTMRIAHVPGHTMQVDWAGTTMELINPITQKIRKVSIFVASLPYSGMLFARGYLDEKLPAWLDAHRCAFEYFDGVVGVIVPDNASTASNAIGKYDQTRQVNQSYADFLEYYQTAAVPTRSYKPKDKGHVESGVKVATQWVIHRLRDHRFHDLDVLNAAIDECLEEINSRTPFRGVHVSRRELFTSEEYEYLTDLPAQPWEPVTWRQAKVHRDWHIQIDSVKYSVPFAHAGQSVDVRISGNDVVVMSNNQIVASHVMPASRYGFVTNSDHAPMNPEIVTGLWSRAYFLRQAAKVGPATVTALNDLLDSKVIEAQGFRSCMNILSLGKGPNRVLLELACEQLLDPQGRKRAISYTGVKNQLAAVRTQQGARPGTAPRRRGTSTQAPPTRGEVTTAHLAGADQFSLDHLRASGQLTSPEANNHNER